MPEFHIGLVELGIAGIASIFWFARLEFKINQYEKDSKTLWKKHDDLSVELRSDLKSMSSSLARIEGFLSIKQKEKE